MMIIATTSDRGSRRGKATTCDDGYFFLSLAAAAA